MQIRFYATLRPIVGGRQIEVALDGDGTAGALLHQLSDRYPRLGAMLWAPDGELTDYIKVFVDGREIRHLDGLATAIQADAAVDIFPPVAGG